MTTNNASTAGYRIAPAKQWGLHTLKNASGLTAEITPAGALHSIRHGVTLLNQYLPGPAENGLFRLLLRWHTDNTTHTNHAPLVGPGLAFGLSGTGVPPVIGSGGMGVPPMDDAPRRNSPDSTQLTHASLPPSAAQWTTTPADGLHAATTFTLHPRETAWAWRVQLRNDSKHTYKLDILHAQDLGLADEAAVRNNEAYVSQYIDILPIATDATLGPVLFARQNQAANGGRFPWLAVACATRASSFCTDGWQFFGRDHRYTAEPAAVREAALSSTRLQYEFSLAGLQSRAVTLAPGATAEIIYVARYQENHIEASSDTDLAAIRTILPATWAHPPLINIPYSPAPLYVSSKWIHGDKPSSADWDRWFPGQHRNIERAPDGTLQSFFCGENTHVVALEKEITTARPHGHIIRSGAGHWIDDAQFGVTSYAAGVFRAQAYYGNTNLSRMTPPVRNALGLARAGGERIFIRHDGAWRQLGIPTAFAMTPDTVRWLYILGNRTLEIRVWCSPRHAVSHLEARVLDGAPVELLITQTLSLGPSEYEHSGDVRIHTAENWATLTPAPENIMAQHMPGIGFAIATHTAKTEVVFGNDADLYADNQNHNGPYITLRTTRSVSKLGIILAGGPVEKLPALIAAAREEITATTTTATIPHSAFRIPHSTAPSAPVRFETRSADIARINEILPWFSQNASIHFSAPHGLEQYSGAAWGTRDVCQGSLEWMLSRGDYTAAREMLLTVFAQQYPHIGDWPQWFMHPPFRFIQQDHSHGDVCFWPVKALCDYIEATNDLALLNEKVDYTDRKKFIPANNRETLLEHCDRVVAHCESRFMPGTALVNYGDGDWDDTLQPADPTLRTRMVSAWTVGLSYHTLRQLADICRRAGETKRAAHLDTLLEKIRADFNARLMPDGIVAGFLVNETDGPRVLLHPRDTITGIQYRLLPMTRSILAELFTPEQAASHLALIRKELLCPDGARLMNKPARYHGGRERLFKRADSAANFGREIGLQYVHAHIRYAEALAKVGDAEALWKALQVINPVGNHETVPNAAPRQANVYYSSSDADYNTRYEAAARWDEVRKGTVPVRGGWRLYSSGPGMYVHKIRAHLLGLRETFGNITIDPVLPRALDGLTAHAHLCERPVTIEYHIKKHTHAPTAITVNGTRHEATTREKNPYRTGGMLIPADTLRAHLRETNNHITVEM